MHCAGAALAQTAAETGIVEPHMVAQRIQQRHVGVGVDRVLLAIDIKDECCVMEHLRDADQSRWRADAVYPFGGPLWGSLTA